MKIKNNEFLEVGKLPAETLKIMLGILSKNDPDLVLGPGIGLDCAVIDLGDKYMIVKSDPITFVTKDIGWYAVQIISNDIYTTGADPKWIFPTFLLPENRTTQESVLDIAQQFVIACNKKGIVIAGGHTEITSGLDRAIISCTAIGYIEKTKLLSPRNIQAGDQIILTKEIPIEGIAILANEFESLLKNCLDHEQIEQAKNFIYDPGISVEKDKNIAINTAPIHAMHDPTEGGLSGGLWELAEACNKHFIINPDAILISPLSKTICELFDADPWCTIASGSLLIVVPPTSTTLIVDQLKKNGIPSSLIGEVEEKSAMVSIRNNNGLVPLHRPNRDEIARIFERKS